MTSFFLKLVTGKYDTQALAFSQVLYLDLKIQSLMLISLR